MAAERSARRVLTAIARLWNRQLARCGSSLIPLITRENCSSCASTASTAITDTTGLAASRKESSPSTSPAPREPITLSGLPSWCSTRLTLPDSTVKMLSLGTPSLMSFWPGLNFLWAPFLAKRCSSGSAALRWEWVWPMLALSTP